MIKSETDKKTFSEMWVIPSIQVFSGSVLLALISQVAIPLPFTPVPLSLQTFTIFMLAMTLGSKKGTASVLTYLAQGTIGLPVFAGGLSNPAWIMGPRGGYLIGFALAAWVVGKLYESCSNKSLKNTLLILFAGEAMILIPGALWLAAFVGYSNAFSLGVAPFLAGGALKIIAASLLIAPTQKVFKKLFG
ncbi:MAG: biotin transporter BioY [Chlamydiia bacterium]|nr:biotin transporter BioY [Chlamydiia bacterium]